MSKQNFKNITDTDIFNWMKEFNLLRHELLRIGPFRKGSIFEYWNVCGTANCKCKKSKDLRHGPYYSWTKKEKAKTVTLRVPGSMLCEAKSFVNNAKLINEKIKEMEEVSDKIIRRRIEIERKMSSRNHSKKTTTSKKN